MDMGSLLKKYINLEKKRKKAETNKDEFFIFYFYRRLNQGQIPFLNTS